MKHGYISKVNSVKEFQEYISLFEQKGVALDNVTVNLDFEEFISSLSSGDKAVICSYIEVFSSLGAYLSTAIELLERDITLESLQEPEVIIDNSNCEFIRELTAMGRQLRSTSSHKSMDRLKQQGRKVGRPCGSSLELQRKVARVEKLRGESNISVINACKLAGCNPKAYYRLKNKAV